MQSIENISDNSNVAVAGTGTDYVGLMRKQLYEWNSKPRTGWHVSDVTLCLGKKAFQDIDPKPPTDKELHYFTTGRSIHEAIQSLYYTNRSRFEKEKYVEYKGIEGHVDVYDKKKNVPIEFKTYRGESISKPMSFHEQQIKYYMAILGSTEGCIIYDLLTHKGANPWRSFMVTMDDDEIYQQLHQLTEKTLSLQNAIRKKNPSLTDLIYDNPELNWLCKDCPYRLECEAIR